MLRPELQRSRELLRAYAVDPKLAKSDLLNSIGAPEFPDNEWANVLAGRSVDLDHVISGRYNVSAGQRRVEKLGDFELAYGSGTPTKRVESMGDWVLAWNQTVAAVSYAFPHRRRELTEYGSYIVGLFGALAVSFHHRLIDHEKAVRKRVASRQNLLLTDYKDFDDLRLQFIDSCGAAVGRHSGSEERSNRAGGQGSAPRRKKEAEACRRWNSGICTTPASQCRYRHICTGCSSVAHPRSECPKAANRSE